MIRINIDFLALSYTGKDPLYQRELKSFFEENAVWSEIFRLLECTIHIREHLTHPVQILYDNLRPLRRAVGNLPFRVLIGGDGTSIDVIRSVREITETRCQESAIEKHF